MHEGRLVLAERTHRALCLEYMSKGSLENYISDECDRYDWHTAYGIINGICQGLKCLHTELKPPIYHLDLKPANVLLDENMVPRIADFGMSRLFRDEHTQVQGNWTNRLHETSNLKRAYSEQVKICVEIGLSCVQEDRHKRPTIQDIVDRLNETVAKCTYAARKDLLIYQEADKNTSPQYAQESNDRHAERIYHGSTFTQDTKCITHAIRFEENIGPAEARLDGDSSNHNQHYSVDGDSLPGIEGFQIVGDPRPGHTVRACGFPINGTTLCKFKWVRYLEGGTRQPIEGATMYDYMVTADDVGALLAVYCTPMDNNDRQGHLVSEFANNTKRITCDPEMKNAFNICMSMRGCNFNVFVQGHSPEEWEHATLVLKRSGYQINFRLKDEDEVIIDEKYSPNVQLKIPNGRTTQFVLVRSGGVNLPFNTQGITEPNTVEDNVRLRDIIVLVMRAFQNKALMSPSVPPKKDAINSFAKRTNIDDSPPHPIVDPPARTPNKRFFQRKGPGCVKLAMEIDGY